MAGAPLARPLQGPLQATRPDVFERCLLGWITLLHEVTAAQVIAIEGKTPRQGSDKATARSAISMTGARATAHHIDLGQELRREGKRTIAAWDHDSLEYVLYGA